LGAARSGNVEEARKDIEQLKSIAKALRDKKHTEESDFIEREIAVPEAWILHSQGNDDQAISTLKPLAEKEQKDTEGFSETGDLPATEVFADLLLEAKRPQEALAEYQMDLKLNPNRFNGLYGAARAAEAAGKQSEANEYYSALLKACDGGSSTRPELSHARELVARK
jgi:tetratricopeptide (TPR) repeat protein